MKMQTWGAVPAVIFLQAVCIGSVNAQSGGTAPCVRAYDFWNSTGINIMANGTAADAYHNYTQLTTNLSQLGIAHVRCGLDNSSPNITWMWPNATTTYTNFIKSLYSSYGITSLLTWDAPGYFGAAGESQINGISGGSPNMWQYVGNDIKNYGSAIDAIEVSNEPDLYTPFVYGGNHFPSGPFYQTAEIKNILGWNGIANVKVCAPPCGQAINYTSSGLNGGLASCGSTPTTTTDCGNGHYYPNYQSLPDTCWGADGGTLQGAINDSRAFTGSQPIYVSESGYNCNWYGTNDPFVQGYFEPLLYCENFRLGSARTYLYELYDEPSKSADQANWGVMSVSGSVSSPKPAYTGIKNMISIVKDTSSTSFTPTNILYSLTGYPSANPNIHYMLMEKSTQNCWYLLIWNDVNIWNNNADVAPSSKESIATVCTTTNRTFTVYAPCESSGTSSTTAFTAWTTGNQIALNVPAELLVVKIQ